MANQDELYLSAEEAAKLLGVNLPTLYAYVGRKNIRSVKIEGSRKRRYWAADIQRLVKGGRNGDKTPGKRGADSQSSLTLLTEDGLFYRGRNIDELVETATVEEVAEMFWQVPGVFGSSLPRMPAGVEQLLELYAHTSVMEKAIALFPLVERENPKAFDLSPEGYARTGADVVRLFAALVVGAAAPDARPLHEFIASARGADQGFADLIRRLLILSIDHELVHSTYSVRAAAKTGVTPYYATIVGLAASRGRRIAYGRNELVSHLLSEVCKAKDPAAPILQYYSQGGDIPGFNTNVHGVVDPRAISLKSTLDVMFADDPDYLRLLKAMQVAEELVQRPAEFILLVSFVGRKLNLEGQELALAAVGRLIGWIAHASEQYNHQPVIRHHARYTGPLPD
ncbi:TPA: citrate synthase [Pseudomonas aeruginosa]|uniref:citrate synthase n=1 Tax=Pseudomonas aeruginosa TaxID=287 RepID=UPI0005BD8B6B|nr:citrate synthase [Pseudomonas aeruginosa]ELM7155051.1 citrate synthase [Pseudomonas aeruginosa]MBI7363587.1 citrate synthase [Pseudomonas aeruginosa]NPS70555.1 helix-turn-helix domain-containing protein [Pseudomonas aeruginosa]PQM13707.1 helix-turn-helix domain-containing protein [Pseudomonas aeruginosa]TEE59215.1 helix-turn-helix domain-containing protein [Pseudomonas aeruginosa]